MKRRKKRRSDAVTAPQPTQNATPKAAVEAPAPADAPSGHSRVVVMPRQKGPARSRFGEQSGANVAEILSALGVVGTPQDDLQADDTAADGGEGAQASLPTLHASHVTALLQHGLLRSTAPTIYIPPPPLPPEQQGRYMFFSTFYATAGIGVALLLIFVGFCAVLAGISAWRNWSASDTSPKSAPSEITIMVDNDASPNQPVTLSCAVDDNSMLRVAADNTSYRALSDVIILIDDSEKPDAVLATVKVGQLFAGQMKTVFKPVPGLRQIAQAGHARIRVAPPKDSPAT